MGCYINPNNSMEHGAKEEWLREFAERTPGPTMPTETHVPICYVNNGWMTAAAVGFSTSEVEAFNSPRDARPKAWFRAKREDVRKVSDLANYERYDNPNFRD